MTLIFQHPHLPYLPSQNPLPQTTGAVWLAVDCVGGEPPSFLWVKMVGVATIRPTIPCAGQQARAGTIRPDSLCGEPLHSVETVFQTNRCAINCNLVGSIVASILCGVWLQGVQTISRTIRCPSRPNLVPTICANYFCGSRHNLVGN